MVHGVPFTSFSLWRHYMETLSALLTFCAGSPLAIGGLPHKRPVTRAFDISLLFARKIIEQIVDFPVIWDARCFSDVIVMFRHHIQHHKDVRHWPWMHMRHCILYFIWHFPFATASFPQLTQCGLVTLRDDIIWTNLILSSNVFCGIHLRAISQNTLPNLLNP